MLASVFWSPGLCWSSATGAFACLPQHKLAASRQGWRGPRTCVAGSQLVVTVTLPHVMVQRSVLDWLTSTG